MDAKQTERIGCQLWIIILLLAIIAAPVGFATLAYIKVTGDAEIRRREAVEAEQERREAVKQRLEERRNR